MFLYELEFNSAVIEFFKSETAVLEGGNAGYFYSDSYGHRIAVEIFGLGKWNVPSTSGIWEICKGWPSEVRELYLFHSPIEAISFFHYNTDKLSRFESVAIIALGLVPQKTQVKQVFQKYKNARIHLVLGTHILDRTADCLITSWVKKKDLKLFLTDRKLRAVFQNKSYDFDLAHFSLSRFEKLMGMRSAIRTHKPARPYETFFNQFISNKSI